MLFGGGNGDVLKGGVGDDRFVYTALSDSTVSGLGKDTIADFSTGDKIDLSGIGIAFSFGTGGFTGHAGEVRVVTSGSIQVVYADSNGDKTPDFAINVISDHTLTAADFML
ncbi:MAG: M10 family metallopeptidase C-terminal domain-containing protein [Inquilinus sp.]|uniref:M10 family metallopeptidase C-terminal domain-containing protein n=1 Tax=Inquilinus sp. TaxID=1932117 RepID=UPI003F3C89C8